MISLNYILIRDVSGEQPAVTLLIFGMLVAVLAPVLWPPGGLAATVVRPLRMTDLGKPSSFRRACWGLEMSRAKAVKLVAQQGL